jgi:RNA polymerase sigma-70 factor (ECF subfamily)
MQEAEMTRSDEALINALKAGDLDAFRRLFLKHEGTMLRLATQILGNRADAEDAVQDAFLTLFRKVSGFRGRSSFTTWFYRIVVNACLKIREKRRPAEGLDAHAPRVAGRDRDACADREVRDALEAGIAGLPMQQRLVFTLAEVEGFSPVRIGTILDLRPGTVRFHLFKAREKLRERLRPFFRDPREGRGK